MPGIWSSWSPSFWRSSTADQQQRCLSGLAVSEQERMIRSVHGHTLRATPTAINDHHGKPAWFIDLGPNMPKIAIHHSETGVHVLDTPAERPGLLSALRNPLDFSGRSSVRPAKTKVK